MKDTELYRHLLGIEKPWTLARVELDVKEQQVNVFVERKPGEKFTCSECGRKLGVYDHAEERSWRHLDSCQFATILRARTPRVECPEHGGSSPRPRCPSRGVRRRRSTSLSWYHHTRATVRLHARVRGFGLFGRRHDHPPGPCTPITEVWNMAVDDERAHPAAASTSNDFAALTALLAEHRCTAVIVTSRVGSDMQSIAPSD